MTALSSFPCYLQVNLKKFFSFLRSTKENAYYLCTVHEAVTVLYVMRFNGMDAIFDRPGTFCLDLMCSVFLTRELVSILWHSFTAFCAKNSFNLGSEMRKIKLQTIVGNLLHELRKLNMNGTVTGVENSRQYLLLRTDILQKTVVENPCCFMLMLSRILLKLHGVESAHPESKKIYLFLIKICLNKIWLTCIHVLNRGSLLFDHWSHFTYKKTSNKIHSPLRFLFLRNFNSEDHQPPNVRVSIFIRTCESVHGAND